MFHICINHLIHDTLTIEAEFELKAGEITTLIGKSGSGKSSLLNLITGVIHGKNVQIESDTVTYQDIQTGTFIPVHERKFGYIQQKAQLFSHLSVWENLTYSRVPLDEKKLEDYLDIFELRPHLNKRVRELSGGEAQRVSIVRTLMSEPELLLIDEGFSALDPNLRLKLRDYLQTLKKELNIPILFVTHDLYEAYQLSDYVLFIENGKLIEQGTKKQMFHFPSNIKTARFIGVENIFKASSEDGQLKIDDQLFEVDVSNVQVKSIGIKATHVSIHEEGLPAHVEKVIDDLTSVTIYLRLNGLHHPLLMKLSPLEAAKHQLHLHQQLNVKIHQFIFLEGHCD